LGLKTTEFPHLNWPDNPELGWPDQAETGWPDVSELGGRIRPNFALYSKFEIVDLNKEFQIVNTIVIDGRYRDGYAIFVKNKK